MPDTKIITMNWPIFTHAELNPANPPATTEGRKKAKADDEAAELATSPKGIRNGPVTIVADEAIGDPDDLPNRSFAGAVLRQLTPGTHWKIIRKFDPSDRFAVQCDHLEVESREHSFHLMMLAFINDQTTT